MSSKWSLDKKHEAKVKQVYLQPVNNGHSAVFAVEFDRRIEVNAKEFGFVLDEQQLMRLAAFINATRAKQLITLPHIQTRTR